MIDEPESSLHPPQAYHMGRFIGKYAENGKQCTFVATHSGNILRGIVETNKNVTIIRLTNNNDEFSAHRVSREHVDEIIRNPRVRTETILDGVFSKGVVIVEGDGDRDVYQAAAEGMPDFPSREIHFAAVYGNGGFDEPCKFYRRLDIPVAIIADLDTVCEAGTIEAVVRTLAEPSVGEALINSIRKLANQIKAIPPILQPDEVKKRIAALAEMPMNWAGGDDNAIRGELGRLREDVRRLRFKKGGIKAYQDHLEVMAAISDVIAKCKQIGIFLVPVGALEMWVPQLMTEVPSELSKPERAAIMASMIRQEPNKTGDVWEFVKEVYSFLK